MMAPMRLNALAPFALVLSLALAACADPAPPPAAPVQAPGARPMSATATPSGYARPTNVAEPLRGIGAHLRGDISSVAFDPSKTGCADDVGPKLDWSRVPIAPASDTCIHAAFDNASSIASDHFKPKIAAAAYACFTANGPEGNCAPSRVSACNHAALMSACLDPSAEAVCDVIDTRCKGVERAMCLSYVSGLSAEGRRHLVECLSDACGRGFLSCTTLL
jgi:hypothetical protein